MKSIKPGRGPSGMKAISAVVGIVFGVFWTIAAASMGAPPFFPLFGVVFIIMGCANFYYNYKNATGENRFSEFDIVDKSDEVDPLEKHFGYDKTHGTNTAPNSNSSDISAMNKNDFQFCPYCGTKLDSEYKFCPKCGKEI